MLHGPAFAGIAPVKDDAISPKLRRQKSPNNKKLRRYWLRGFECE